VNQAKGAVVNISTPGLRHKKGQFNYINSRERKATHEHSEQKSEFWAKSEMPAITSVLSF
jgi:hypothetical protein